MAKLRGIGRGVQASADTISGLIDQYIKNAFLEESQNRQNNLVAKRQRELAELAHRQNITERAFANPNDANRLIQNQSPNLSGVDLTPFRSTSNELAAPIFKQLGDAKTPVDLPTELQAQLQLTNALPPELVGEAGIPVRDDVLKFREDRMNQLDREALMAQRNEPHIGAGPGGEPVTGRMLRDNTFMPTTLTGTQQGQQDLSKLQASEGNPAWARIKGDVAQETASGTAMGTVLGRHAVLPEVEAVSRADSRGAALGRVDATGTSSNMMGNALRMIDLAKKINVTARGKDPTFFDNIKHTLVNRAGGQLELLFQSNPDIKELNDLVEAVTPDFARLLGHTGVLTQRDVDSTKAILPDWGLFAEDSERRIANFTRLMQRGQRMGAALGTIDPNLSPEQQSLEYQRRLRELMASESPNVVPYNQLFPQ